ncbi:MAG: HAMP domain-containing protein [Desulfobacteraceae bacterium]|nr:MAG: HAMP domain-containing protein [Desulfobacteraceae bacterium]
MKQAKFSLNLKTKLVVLFLALALAPLAIVGAFSIHITGELIVNLVLRQLENVAADKAAILDRWVGERKSDLQVIAGTSILKTMDPQQIAPYLNLVGQHYGVYKDITVVDNAGERVFSTNGISTPAGSVPWNHAADAPLLPSAITYLPNETESTFQIAAPIRSNDDIQGMVFGTVGTHNIIYSILNVSLGQTGECYLVDKDGTFLAHKEPHRILAENISQSDSFKNIFGVRDRTKTYLDYRGIEVLGTSKKVGATDWYLVVEQDRAEAFHSVTVLKRTIFFTVLLCVSSAFLITWIISYHVVRPIRALSRSAHNLADAQFDSGKIKMDRQDEIGMLYRAFEDMARKVRERQDSLEQEVNLKDAELKETDLILKQIKVIAERSEKFAAIGRLGAAVAHEIRTPLTSLKLFLESVEAEIAISQEYEEDFEVAMSQIRRIEGAINRFLEYSKPQELNISKVCVPELIEESVSMIRPMANKQESALAVTVEGGLPEIDADQKFLEETLVNLMVNALEAMGAKGQLFVSAGKDRCRFSEKDQNCIRIDVRDTGPGISDVHMHMIFDPFFTTKASGTGLGLPLVLNTIQRHGGAVHVRNQEGGGAVFSIFLPYSTTAASHGKNTADR